MSRTSPKSGQRDTKAALSALFPRLQGQREIPGLMLIERSRIQLKPQVRADVSSGVDELRENIASLHARRLGIEGTGILQPLLVAPDSNETGTFRLIAGERRFRASQGVCDEVPVIVVNADDTAIPILQLIENLQRRDLPPLDEAHGLQQLISNESLSIRQAALLIGKPKSYLSDRLALLKMGLDIHEMLSQRSDTLLHAREIHALTDPKLRRTLIHEIIHNSLSLNDLKRRTAPDGAGSVRKPTISSTNGGVAVSERSDTATKIPHPVANRANNDLVTAFETLLAAASTTREQLGNVTPTRSQKRQLQAQIKEIEACLTSMKTILHA